MERGKGASGFARVWRGICARGLLQAEDRTSAASLCRRRGGCRVFEEMVSGEVGTQVELETGSGLVLATELRRPGHSGGGKSAPRQIGRAGSGEEVSRGGVTPSLTVCTRPELGLDPKPRVTVVEGRRVLCFRDFYWCACLLPSPP